MRHIVATVSQQIQCRNDYVHLLDNYMYTAGIMLQQWYTVSQQLHTPVIEHISTIIYTSARNYTKCLKTRTNLYTQ